MENNENLKDKAARRLLPITKESEIIEALKLFDITLTLSLDDESRGPEISFLDRGDLRRFIKGEF
jgi:hypothetical protein